MPSNRLKEKISALVSSQLPEFVRADYPKFVAFLEAYYRFLEQDEHSLELVQNARSYADIDRTAASFIDYFVKQYAFDFPITTVTNKRFLIKNIKDLFESKGSELSFKLFFKTLFDTDVTIEYPYDFVLRSSDGRWEQKISIRVETVSGSILDITDRFLKYFYDDGKKASTYETPITEIKILNNNLTEIYLDRTKLAPNYILEDFVYVTDENDNTIFIGKIKPTALTVQVDTPGSGFKVGQIYSVNSGNTFGTFIQVKSLDANAGISSAKIINYGYGFTSNLIIDLDPDKKISEIYTPPLPNNVATVTLVVGSLSRYPGTFNKVNGLLSVPEVCLADDRLFQPFSYLTNTDLDVKRFYNLAKNIVHPAGKQLYNRVNFKNDISFAQTLDFIPTSNISIDLYDKFDLNDTISISSIFERSFSDNIQPTESISKNFILSNIDLSVSLSDTQSLSIFVSGAGNTYFAEDYQSEDYVGEVTIIF